jgi:UDP-galactopyranose mutase
MSTGNSQGSAVHADWLIVGAGLTGATLAERIATQRGESVVIVDQRDHIGGNAYDEYNEHGILTHKYGPHIFHTNSREVFDYLSNFTAWRPYMHRVLGAVEGRLAPLPFNLDSLEALFTPALAARMAEKLVSSYGFGARIPILKLREAEDADLKFLADYVYRNVFENYTKKQWGLTPEELSPAVTARAPIRVSRDDRYFQDEYQAMPRDGYTAMARRMLAHPNIRILLKTRWQEAKDEIRHERLVFTGPIDEFFEFRHGALPYRSLRFEVETHQVERYQQAAVINYPNDYAYTRITEPKWLTAQKHDATTIVVEYPQAHEHGKTIPYYPIPTDASRAQFKLYEEEAARLGGEVIFAGRLADYQYYNMDQAVARALAIFRKLA